MGSANGNYMLALDAGLVETGWAVLDPSHGGLPLATGIIKVPSSRKSCAKYRIKALLLELDELSEQWMPGVLVHTRPTRIRWPVPALNLLEERLRHWANARGIDLCAYPAQQVWTAIGGSPSSSKNDLAYAVMERLELIGRSKSSREWEAVAVGYFHLLQGAPVQP